MQTVENFRDQKWLFALYAVSVMRKSYYFPVHFLPGNSVLFLYKVDELENVELRIWLMQSFVLALGVN